MTPTMRKLLWILGAFAGVVLAAGVTYAASSLSTQRIGISSEPASAGQDLAPARPESPTPPATPTVDDDGGSDDSSGRGRGRGRGSDDGGLDD